MPDRLTGRALVLATGHALSLALFVDGCLEARHEETIERGHAERLMPAVATLLACGSGPPGPCDRVIFEVGPGSFTGLRVGAAAARALALAWGAALAGVRSTLLVAAAARSLGVSAPIAVALRAPRGQLWVERFAADGLQSLGPPAALSPGRLPPLAGYERAGDGFPDTALGHLRPQAASIAFLDQGDFSPPDLLYVREAGLDAAA